MRFCMRCCMMVKRGRTVFALCGALLLPLCLLSLSAGVSSVGLGDFLRAIALGEITEKAARVLWHVRLPRLLAALLAGASLSLAGVILQEVLINPLAAPSVIGVNAGAGLFTLAALVLFPAFPRVTPVAAFLGALFSALLVYGLARFAGLSKTTIVLAGVAVSSLLGAFMDAIVTFVPDALGSRSAFSIGGFSSVSMAKLEFALPFCLVGMTVALLLQRELSILSMGDEVARSLGLRVNGYRLLFLTAAAMLAGGAISFSGLLSFIGLITPHVARRLIGRDTAYLMPVSMTLGALLLAACDLMARTLFAPYELPVGVILSFVGAPFFLRLLIKRKRSNRHDAV